MRKKIALLLITMLSITSLPSYESIRAKGSTQESNIHIAVASAEAEDCANSWRYEDGSLRQDKNVFTKTAIEEQAWTKVDGVFVNANGEEIKGATLKGIDVSHYQEKIDWEKVKKTEVAYAILRCGYGQDLVSQDDAYWADNAESCTKYDIPFGAYLYSYATTVEKAVGEAEHVLRLVEGYDLRYPIYYDLEDKTLRALSNKELAKIAKAFCDRIEEAGYEVGIYANVDWFENKLTDTSFDQWGRWVAQWGDACTYTKKYNMWQCTEDGKIDGITGNVDIDFVIGENTLVKGKKIMLDKDTLHLYPTETKKIETSIVPRNTFYKTLSWSSSDESIATVQADGSVTAISPGAVTITAKLQESSELTASCQIIVGEKEEPTQLPSATTLPEESMPPLTVATPAATKAFTYEAVTTKAIKLSWKKVSDVDGYAIYRYDSNKKKDILIETIAADQKSYMVKRLNGASGAALSSGTKYTFRIAAYKIIDEKKQYGKMATVHTMTKPDKTKLKVAKKKGKSRIKCTWNKTKAVDGYVLFISNKKTSGYYPIKTIAKNNTLTYTTKKLKKGKVYYIKIKTYRKWNNQIIYSAYSNRKKVKL